MSNSYRIRTTPGVDKSIRVQLDQDFESLEILSLKLFQSDVYTRRCSDYGVLVGRVSINNGFGIPNAKVSVFIPLTDEDEVNLSRRSYNKSLIRLDRCYTRFRI